MSVHGPQVTSAHRWLSGAQNRDGGWGYQRGNLSRLEPTCWALLALGSDVDTGALTRWPTRDGLLLERTGGSPNYAFHGVGLLTLRALQIEHVETNASAVMALQRVKGDALPASRINRQDNSLQAWSWIADTFSWVEPTAWCLLALKQWARAGQSIDHGRVETAERLLVDRCCAAGGWNYGNANMLNQELKAFVPTTALALLSLQDRPALPEVVRSLDFLESHATEERSGTALSLALMALTAFQRPTAAVRDVLIDQLATTVSLGKPSAVAMSLYALNHEGNGHAAVAL